MSTVAVQIRTGLAVPRSLPARSRGARTVPVSARAGGGTRLTRRGRLLVTLFVLVALTGALVAGAASVSARDTSPAPAATTQVVVQPGQTLWALAVAVAPGADPREVVREIRELNGLTGSSVVPGQPLTVPAG